MLTYVWSFDISSFLYLFYNSNLILENIIIYISRKCRTARHEVKPYGRQFIVMLFVHTCEFVEQLFSMKETGRLYLIIVAIKHNNYIEYFNIIHQWFIDIYCGSQVWLHRVEEKDCINLEKMATKLPRELGSVILLWILVVFTFDNKVLGQRTQYDIDREESLRRQRPSVSNIFVYFVVN